MARGIRYIVKRIRQVLILSIGSAVFIGLCFASMGRAGSEKSSSTGGGNTGEKSVQPAQIMQILMAPAGSPVDGCLLPTKIPSIEKCEPFFNVDDQDILENLLHNYTSCLDGNSYYYDFSNQPVIKLKRPLEIYGRTDEPLIIKGMKLTPGKNFPKESPAIVIFGKTVELKDLHLDGFDNGILFASNENVEHQLIGGKINGTSHSSSGIRACFNPPHIDGTVISGYQEMVSVISIKD